MVTEKGVDLMDAMDDIIKDSEHVVDAIRQILGGKHPAVQASAMVQIVALWIAGHAPQIRAEVLAEMVAASNKLVPSIEKAVFGAAGHPGAWFDP